MNSRPDHLPVVVLGAGVTGLYAARMLSAQGIPVVVIEKETEPGGLAAGFERNGNYYDLGVHQLHGFDRDILADLRNLMGERLKPVELRAFIRYGNGFRRYPLQFADLMAGVPFWQLTRALLGLFFQHVVNQFDKTEAANAEAALIKIYGRPSYDYFFRDFTHAYWGFPAKELSAGFVRNKMPRLSALDVIKNNLKKIGLQVQEEATAGALTRETLWYAATGSRELSHTLTRLIEENGGKVSLASSVHQIDTIDGRVTAVRFNRDGEIITLPCSYCISTIPLPDLVRALRPLPDKLILDAGEQLQYKPIAVFGLLVRKHKVLDGLYVHFRDRIFHRIAEPANSGLVVRPEGCTMLIAEMTCQVGDDRWKGGEQTRARLIRDLVEEELITAEEIMEIHHFSVRHAYPVFKLGYEEHLQNIIKYLNGIENLQSIGRQGGFCYPNMHTAMRQGADAALEIGVGPTQLYYYQTHKPNGVGPTEV